LFKLWTHLHFTVTGQMFSPGQQLAFMESVSHVMFGGHGQLQLHIKHIHAFTAHSGEQFSYKNL